MRILPAVAGCVTAAGLALAGCSAGAVPASQLPHTVLLAYDGRPAAELVVTSGADSITIGTGTRGGPLVRAHTPPHSGVRPVLRTGRDRHVVWVGLDHTGLRGPADLRISLSPSVRWRIVLAAGAPILRLDLADARLSWLDIKAGFSTITARLPDPSGQVTATVSGGASSIGVTIPAAVPARLTLAGGAGSATLAGRSYTGIAGGTVLTTPGWPSSTNRYQFDLIAGVSSISVRARTAT
ncbi:MAG TPA: hypothetical protein VMR14_17790 [Streptosporangiaceae bacterium]|nr:hypothetical protein [Streptosporangiaceae bacterium]